MLLPFASIQQEIATRSTFRNNKHASSSRYPNWRINLRHGEMKFGKAGKSCSTKEQMVYAFIVEISSTLPTWRNALKDLKPQAYQLSPGHGDDITEDTLAQMELEDSCRLSFGAE
jgi:hypothetical protein